jgi:DNA-binding transcriptional MerR regulator
MYRRKEDGLAERRLSTSEAAAAVGASPNTVKSWMRDLDLTPPRDEAGRHRWDARALAALVAVKDLRDQGRSYESIRAVIGRPNEAPRPAPDEDRLAMAIAEAVGQVVAGLLRAESDLAEKYARATYELGELRATVRALERELLGEARVPREV